ncbi:MAG: hypothetical protein AVDCRST_MAG77-4471 [uncultured Chloroflexi bacterium]|uniref:Uncharacterized protein n=1 Tax=uncultured Chloroflexota bacterium TaxID=166587 RepID=A0A6J4JUL7_9CHLR|nr:MAG: hypothetical protein AVDCRST_MAG77-4471 [uncultured Chloroflexota bacterium]
MVNAEFGLTQDREQAAPLEPFLNPLPRTVSRSGWRRMTPSPITGPATPAMTANVSATVAAGSCRAAACAYPEVAIAGRADTSHAIQTPSQLARPASPMASRAGHSSGFLFTSTRQLCFPQWRSPWRR